ncbi:interferon-induced protein 44 [Lates calcarifer]|uniref:Interferon-induced protein 44 n=1 Tax=Lates calcarifer TaxID=8187 RepID=A0AAJ7PD67_LATCA|nr:interferon-induced protein 44 [Lates calcarifer]
MGLLDFLRHIGSQNEESSSGTTPSSGPALPPTSPIFTEPWREISWGDKQTGLEYVQDYQPKKEGVSHLRVLLYGPVGSGKSSFINSVSSILRGRMAIPAAVSAATSEISFTTKYETHEIEREDGFYPLVFNDIMGLEDGPNRGVQTEDIKLAMMGHVMDSQQFSPASPLLNGCAGYNKNPSANDRCHILLCVISANAPEIKESVLGTDLGIPQVCILTHIDEACDVTESNLKNVYHSKYIKRKMEEMSSSVGFPMNCIFPVKNYNEEKDLDDDIDTLILDALRYIINFGDDFIKKM